MPSQLFRVLTRACLDTAASSVGRRGTTDRVATRYGTGPVKTATGSAGPSLTVSSTRSRWSVGTSNT